MIVSPEEFRRRFDQLSDEALLEVKRDDLIDVARDLYDAEVGRRGLTVASTAEVAEEATPTPEASQDEMALVAEFDSVQELAFARSLLRSSEIPSYVKNDFSSVLGSLEEDLKLFVPASYLEQANELLAAPLTDEELAAQAEAAGSEEDAEASETEEESAPDKDIQL